MYQHRLVDSDPNDRLAIPRYCTVTGLLRTGKSNRSETGDK